MSLVRHAIRGAGWAIGGGYAAQILSFAMFIVTSRLVGPSAFGTVAIAIAIVELCRAFTTENVAATLVADPNADRGDFDAGFFWTAGSSVLVCVALIFAAPLLAAVFRTPGLAVVLPQIALLLVFYGVSRLHEARLVKTMQFRQLATRTVLAAIVGGSVGVAAAMAGLGVDALIYQQWTAALTSAALLWLGSDWRPRLQVSLTKFRAVLRASLTLAPAQIIYGLSVLLDGAAVAIVAGPAAAGIYNIGKRVVVAMLLALSGALDRVSLATFAKADADLPRLARMIQRAHQLSMLVVFPVFLGMAATSAEIIDVLLGPAWSQAALPMAILLAGGAVAIATSYCENALLVLQRRLRIVGLRTLFILVLVGGLLLFGKYGPPAIAAVSLAACIVQNLAAAYSVSRVTPYRFVSYARTIAAPLALGVAMLVLVCMLRETSGLAQLSPLQRLPILVGAGALFYCCGVWLFARRSLDAAFAAARSAL